jgi:hypothetical protein
MKLITTTQAPCIDWLQRQSRDRSVTKAFAILLSLGFLFTVHAHSQINAPDACATLGVNCSHPVTSDTSSSASHGPFSTFGIVAAPTIAGGLLGSLYQNPQGQYYAAGGAAVGGGLGLLAIDFRLKTKTGKVIATTAASALLAGSAAQAYQFHEAWQNHSNSGYTAPSSQTDNAHIAEAAGGAAAVTAVISVFAFHHDKLKTSKLQNAPPIVRTLAEAQISGTPRFMSARFAW